MVGVRVTLSCLLLLVLIAGCATPSPNVGSISPVHRATTTTSPPSLPVPLASAAPSATSKAPPATSAPPALTPPKVTDVKVSDVTSTAATISWIVTGSGQVESYVLYGRNSTTLTIHSQHVFGIGPKQIGLDTLHGTYAFVVIAENAGAITRGDVTGFSTIGTPGQPRGETGADEPSPTTTAGGSSAATCGSRAIPPVPDVPAAFPTDFPAGVDGLHFGACPGPNMTLTAVSYVASQIEITVWCGGLGKMNLHLDYGADATYTGAPIADQKSTATVPGTGSTKPCARWLVTWTGPGAMHFRVTVTDPTTNDPTNPDISPDLTAYATVVDSTIIFCRHPGMCSAPNAPPDYSTLGFTVCVGQPFLLSFVNHDSLAQSVSLQGSPVLTTPSIAPNGSGTIVSSSKGYITPGSYAWSLSGAPTATGTLTVSNAAADSCT